MSLVNHLLNPNGVVVVNDAKQTDFDCEFIHENKTEIIEIIKKPCLFILADYGLISTKTAEANIRQSKFHFSLSFL